MEQAMVYIFDDIESFDSETLYRAEEIVSRQRMEYARKYHFEIDRKLSLAAYILLQKGLTEHFGISGKLIFDFNKTGKPILKNYPQIEFNLSHCRKGVACAISSSPIGIDIEEIKPLDDDLMQACCNQEEIAAIISSDSPAVEFIKLWTHKESYLKMIGKGLTYNLRDTLKPLQTAPDLTFLSYHNQEKGYLCTTCGHTKIPQPIIFKEIV